MAKQTYKQKVKSLEVENEINLYTESEFVEGYIDMKLPRKHHFNNGGFITVFQQAMMNISINAELSRGEYKLLVFLLGTAGMDNSVNTDLGSLCELLKEKKSNMSKALRGLTDRNIVIRNDISRNSQNILSMDLAINYNQINYDLAYNGKTKEYGKKKEIHPEIMAEPLGLIEDKKPNLFNLNHDETKK